MSFSFIKEKIVDFIKLTEFGNRKFYKFKDMIGRNPVPDLSYPQLISIEVSSICNLSCSHCPPHMKKYSDQTRTHKHIDYDLFNRVMDEIDAHGKREIALHKDGETLIHPDIKEILNRVKKNVPHKVYLSTNALSLSQELIDVIIENRIDVINFSIGASGEEFYRKVRGRGFEKVIKNIHNFLSKKEMSRWKPKVIVQIIDLPEYPEMKREIREFKKYWKKFDVEITVWKKLTWAVLEGNTIFRYRYPCYSLWQSFNINSNGIVTACCIDWKQELVIGNVFEQNIENIWRGKNINELRSKHIESGENEIDACRTCNYWKWQPMLLQYSCVNC